MNETLKEYLNFEGKWASDCCGFLLDYCHWDAVYNEKGIQIALVSSEVNQNLDTRDWAKIEEDELENLFQKYWKEDGEEQEQFFAVLFARVHNLSENQIRQIGDKRREKYALDMLNYFLCNRQDEKEYNPEDYEFGTASCSFSLQYYINLDNDYEKAHKIDIEKVRNEGILYPFGYLCLLDECFAYVLKNVNEKA